jgi:5'-phosphate synthase pdxT subunit
MRVGVVALQGGVAPHLEALREIGCDAVPVRRADEAAACDGLVLPGGESTAQARLMASSGLDQAMVDHVRQGRPVLGTCAGLVLLACDGAPGDRARRLRHLDVTIDRNAWGPQIESFEARSDDGRLPLVFIRAPRIRAVGDAVEVLARYAGEPVLVRQGAVVAATFHPELTPDRTVHRVAFHEA